MKHYNTNKPDFNDDGGYSADALLAELIDTSVKTEGAYSIVATPPGNFHVIEVTSFDNRYELMRYCEEQGIHLDGVIRPQELDNAQEQMRKFEEWQFGDDDDDDYFGF